MVNNLDILISKIQKSGGQIDSACVEIDDSTLKFDSTITEQASSTQEVSSSSKKIAKTSENLIKKIQEVNNTVFSTVGMAEDGNKNLVVMEKTISGLITATSTISSKLEVINNKANKISGVVTTITRISEQTNLLSLNAAIEAEKAGEFGKGFSVVSSEISRLADQTAVATQDIEYMVKEMQSSVSSGVMEMDKFSEEVRKSVSIIADINTKLGNVITHVKDLGPQFQSFKNEMLLQVTSAIQISEAMEQLAKSVNLNKNSLNDLKSAKEQLKISVQNLREDI